MAQALLHFKKTHDIKYYHIIVGHKTVNILHPELFGPRGKIIKDGKEVLVNGQWPKTYDIDSWNLTNELVYKWASKSQHYNALDNQQKRIINTIKKFLNEPQWSVLLVFHDTECRDSKTKHTYRYGNHLHIILETTKTQFSKDNLYRAMQGAICNIGGTCTLKPVLDTMDGLIKYLAEDPEKMFLGTNSDYLKDLFKDSENLQATTTTEGEELAPHQPQEEKRKNIKFVSEVKAKTGEDEEIPPDSLPTNLTKTTKSADYTQFMIDLIKKNKDCQDLTTLACKYGLETETGKAICHIALSNQGQKIFQLALRKIQEEDDSKPIGDAVKNLPEKMPGYMSIEHSQAMLNAWCREQGINARKFVATMQMLLEGASYKKVGLYLQGAPNSGKTALTNNMWGCMGRLVGKITKENFLFQDCAGKKIIVGEETTITVANVERYKDLLSGATVKVEIKNKAPEDCTPQIVMLNSNNRYNQNIGGTAAEAIRVRVYMYEGLRRSTILKNMTGHFHPRMFYDGVTPVSQDEIYKLLQNTGEWTDEAVGWGEEYTGDWTEIRGAASQEIPIITGLTYQSYNPSYFPEETDRFYWACLESCPPQWQKINKNRADTPDYTYYTKEGADQEVVRYNQELKHKNKYYTGRTYNNEEYTYPEIAVGTSIWAQTKQEEEQQRQYDKLTREEYENVEQAEQQRAFIEYSGWGDKDDSFDKEACEALDQLEKIMQNQPSTSSENYEPTAKRPKTLDLTQDEDTMEVTNVIDIIEETIEQNHDSHPFARFRQCVNNMVTFYCRPGSNNGRKWRFTAEYGRPIPKVEKSDAELIQKKGLKHLHIYRDDGSRYIATRFVHTRMREAYTEVKLHDNKGMCFYVCQVPREHYYSRPILSISFHDTTDEYYTQQNSSIPITGCRRHDSQRECAFKILNTVQYIRQIDGESMAPPPYNPEHRDTIKRLLQNLIDDGNDINADDLTDEPEEKNIKYVETRQDIEWETGSTCNIQIDRAENLQVGGSITIYQTRPGDAPKR